MQIKWALNKSRYNIRKHGVSFHEAATALYDTMSVTGFDPDILFMNIDSYPWCGHSGLMNKVGSGHRIAAGRRRSIRPA